MESKSLETIREGSWVCHRLQNSKPIDTRSERQCVLSKTQCPQSDAEKIDMSKVSYASVVGRLMYTMLCTRPNICFVVSLESGFQSNTRRSH